MEDIKNEAMREVGQMPSEGYLGVAYVPYQKPDCPKYSNEDALKNGTLYPGLNLPYKNYMPSKEVGATQLGQLMSIDFALGELGLYLDTHPGDAEALKLYNNLVGMYKESMMAYEKKFGPITQKTEMDGHYQWVNNPWPWEVK